jgi:hypothetical protein
VAKTAVTGAVITPFRAVFIENENSPELREFRERLRDILSAPPLIPPHISLLYTLDRNSQAPRSDFDAERLKAIAAGCAEAIDDAHFTLSGPVVNNREPGVSMLLPEDGRLWRPMRKAARDTVVPAIPVSEAIRRTLQQRRGRGERR